MSLLDAEKSDSPELESALEQYLAAPAQREEQFSRLCAAIKKAIKSGGFDQSARVLRRIASAELDFTSVQTLLRLFHACRGKCAPSSQTLRLAVLSSFTSDQLSAMVELFLFAAGVDLELYEADFGVFRQEIIEENSGLYQFKPKTVFIATTWRDLTCWPGLEDDAEQARACIGHELEQWTSLWETAHRRLRCQIIQNNFDQPLWRQLGNHEMRHPASMSRFTAQMNQAMQDAAPPYVTIHDIDGLSAWLGRRLWGDDRFFHHAKLPCAPECLVHYAHHLASVLIAQMGLAKKCLVLDLDNTLWGGVIGDDGLGGIRLGQGDAEGEGFLAFQKYVKKLRQRGVILAVCSKNTDAVARDVFLKHPEMALKLEDIACFTANWEDKATNLRSIAAELNIGLNSLVFLDDNPAERAIARRLVPEVAVPEVSGDPQDFIDALERHRYFQLVFLGREDLRRTDYYRGNAERKQVASSAQSIEEFLQSLNMTAMIGPINDLTLERSTQLINKSNQFNLTTLRRSAAQVSEIMRDPRWLTRTVSLKDRFGDNGLISVLLAKIDGQTLEIDTWLMSCRVLKRNVEKLLLNDICRFAAQNGLSKITGKYLPTEKNALVKDHYTDLGFAVLARETSGECRYELAVAGYQPSDTFIEIQATP